MKANSKVPHLREGENLILFDGVCKLCNAWNHFIVRHDRQRRFKLASVQSSEGQAILAHFGYPLDHYDTMLVVHGGACYEKSEAFLLVMRMLGWPWRLALLARVVPGLLRNWLYDRIARNRYRLFGRYDYCALPNPEHAGRYLSGH
ncbi:thiol-disulfide oxidoreductase DCC family protein [Massilia sp. Dwa41.01b]|uniref:thiol-disulfide oxidoreductase DCC family protein n=1 Tax=unclassified Massilia TaxID=2609279 RepID=UPI0016006C40|nr:MULTISPECIES: thiol-disulfide oxidoreductase DCC family protein [unclassified Massilia]QNA87544.1 thiol-disulfide oxidoreductase DCC family protein [Massilia sp. Dwa41.01b]QNA98455.1 thiol-disulfide oxidoreductase DCC family protein [Massilia sp. Se16.2.3]